jgi:hypothetical protein
MMYDYETGPNPLILLCTPSNIDFKLDNIPIAYPYVPRICREQGHMLIWYGTLETDPDISEACFSVKNEEQWITCEEDWKIEKGIVLVYPYENEIIIGSLKIPGYFHSRTPSQQRQFLRKMWRDVIVMFGNKRIICPSGGYFNYLHLTMNQIRIPREAYHRELMKQFKFVRNGDYWVREPDEHLLS